MYIELFLYNYNIFCIVNCFVGYEFNNIVVVVLGEEVNWVQCDRCEEWYYLLCVGLGIDEVIEDEEYECFKCKNSDSGLIYVYFFFISVEGVVNSLRESMEYLFMIVNSEGVVRNSMVRESIIISILSGVAVIREIEVFFREDIEVGFREKIGSVFIQIQSFIKIQEFCLQKFFASSKVLEGVVFKLVIEKLEAESFVIFEEEEEELFEDSVEDSVFQEVDSF